MVDDRKGFDDQPTVDQTVEKSRTEKKREAEALQVTGERLVGLTDAQLEQLDLPETLFDSIKLAQAIKSHGGKKRQMQFIGKLMRDEQLDIEAINLFFLRLGGAVSSESKAFKAIEQWRDTLLEGGKEALNRFLVAFPHADIQQLRQLLRNASHPKNDKLVKKSRKALFHYIKQLSEDQ